MTAPADRTRSEEFEVILEHYKAMSPTAKVIFLAGLRAVTDRVISIEEMDARTTALLERHIAGEELTVADLESIRAPQDVG